MKQVPVIRKPTPRPYQMEARDNFLAGTGNMLIQLPTGTGKTLTSVIICEAYPGERVLFLAPTGTLVYQTCQAFMKNGLWPNVEKAEEYRGTPYLPDEKEWRKMFPGGRPPTDAFVADRVWVSTIQSFVDRVDKYRDQPFDLVVCDEAHRSLAKSWVKTVERLVSFNSSTRVLGLSATPYRGDKQNLGKLFPEFAYRMPIVKGIDDGWLVDVVCERAVLPGVDESMWKIGSGKGGGRDVTDESLAKSMNNRVCIEAIAHEVIERAGTRKGILFLPGVAVTESVSEALNALKPGCSTFIHGSVKPKRDNRRRVRMIEDGKVQFVCGCDALIEGFDVPDIALVVMARFTAQRGRYEQMLGRGLRVLAKSIEGLNTPAERKAAIAASAKPNCAVLDFANSSRFRLMSVEDILLDPTDEGGGKRAKERADFVRANRDPADKRAMREQLDILDSIYALQEAARKNAGPPPKLEWQYERANLFGYGGSVVTPTVGKKTDARRPTSEMVRQAEDLFVENAEGMTQGQLQAEIARRKERMAGKKGFGFLVYGCKIPPADVKRLRLNWHDAHYLRRLLKSSGRDTLPGNWQDMVAKNRQQRLQGVANG